MAVAHVNNKPTLLAFGGTSKEAGVWKYSDSVEIWNPDTESWTPGSKRWIATDQIDHIDSRLNTMNVPSNLSKARDRG